jgi:starch synthase
MLVSRYPAVLFVCAELYPLAKTGGLADVCAALPRALARKGLDVRVMLPAYPCALAGIEGLLPVLQPADGGRILRGRVPDSRVPIYLFDRPDLFAREGGLYQDAERRDWPDNHRRFAAFCRAAATLALHGDGAGWVPDLVHVHDWHAALVPALLALRGRPRPPSVLTIHNLAFQGNFPLDQAAEAGVPAALSRTEVAEFYGQFSFLKAGISTADRLTTVSPTYAREILTPEFGAGLDGVLRSRAKDLVGILNGVDAEVWNPASDAHLPHHYTAQDLRGKRTCKALLQRELGLETAPDVPLVCFTNRLAHQKMADTVLELLPALAARGIQFALHGEGDRALENAFAAASGSSSRLALRVGYREGLMHRLTAGADISLIPSRFEPCGLTALYAMRYGTLPVCRSVGGLADSVVDAGDAPMPRAGATGFGFAEESPAALLAGLDRACARFAGRDIWQLMQRTAMARDFSWDAAALRYLDLYHELLPGLRLHDPAPQRRVA